MAISSVVRSAVVVDWLGPIGQDTDGGACIRADTTWEPV